MDNNFNYGSDIAKYRATRNLNTSLENPQFNVGDTHDVNLNNNSFNINKSYNEHLDTGVNNVKVENNYNNFQNNIVNIQNDIDNINYDNSVKKEDIIVDISLNNSDNNLNNNTFVNNITSVNNNINYDDSTSNIGDDKVTYAPISRKKKNKVSLEIPKELLILFILVLIILVFIYIIPSLYEVFRSIRLGIVR